MTRTQQKAKYNAKNYEQVKIYVARGGRTALQQIADARGMSMAAYIRHLIIADGADVCPDVSTLLGGGGGLHETKDEWYTRVSTTLDALCQPGKPKRRLNRLPTTKRAAAAQSLSSSPTLPEYPTPECAAAAQSLDGSQTLPE